MEYGRRLEVPARGRGQFAQPGYAGGAARQVDRLPRPERAAGSACGPSSHSHSPHVPL